MRRSFVLVCTLFLVGCTSNFSALRSTDDSAIHDLRMEIADLKHALAAAETEVRILEDRMEMIESKASTSKNDDLKMKVASLEKSLEKISNELRAFSTFSTQTTAALAVYRDQITTIDGKLSEIGKLRTTLSQLSKAPQIDTTTYRVTAGDSLEKIARKFQVTVENLKRENNLSSDKIVVGQELAIPIK